MSSARDLAATEQARAWLATWDEAEDARVGGVTHPIRCRIVYDLANAYDALERQAADAQDWQQVASDRADTRDRYKARAVRAEEALRQAENLLAREMWISANPGFAFAEDWDNDALLTAAYDGWLAKARAAVAAAGADTEPEA